MKQKLRWLLILAAALVVTAAISALVFLQRSQPLVLLSIQHSVADRPAYHSWRDGASLQAGVETVVLRRFEAGGLNVISELEGRQHRRLFVEGQLVPIAELVPDVTGAHLLALGQLRCIEQDNDLAGPAKRTRAQFQLHVTVAGGEREIASAAAESSAEADTTLAACQKAGKLAAQDVAEAVTRVMAAKLELR